MQTVLVVGDSQLTALACGVETIPEGRVSFGFLCIQKATISDLKTEVIHANFPWTPDAVCVCVPVCNVKQAIPQAVQDFDALLAAVCYRWPKVCLLLSFVCFSERLFGSNFPVCIIWRVTCH